MMDENGDYSLQMFTTSSWIVHGWSYRIIISIYIINDVAKKKPAETMAKPLAKPLAKPFQDSGQHPLVSPYLVARPLEVGSEVSSSLTPRVLWWTHGCRIICRRGKGWPGKSRGKAGKTKKTHEKRELNMDLEGF